MSPLEQLQADIDAAGVNTSVTLLPPDRRGMPDGWVVDVHDPAGVAIYGHERGELELYRRVADEQEAADVLRQVTVDRPAPVRRTAEEQAASLRRSEARRAELQRKFARRPDPDR